MTNRYYICGMVGSGSPDDLYRPEIADEATALGCVAWAMNENAEGTRCIVYIADPDDSLCAALGYSATNRNGYDYYEIADDGSVRLYAA